MTGKRRDATSDNPLGGDTPNGYWIRHRPELDSRLGYDLEDIDRVHGRRYWLHDYFRGYIMLIEEKENYAEPRYAQKDTLNVVSQLLRNGTKIPVKRLKSGRPSEIVYFGYNLVQFEHTCATDGGIRINRKQVTVGEYLRFLQFDKQFFEDRLCWRPREVPVDELDYPSSQIHKRRMRKGKQLIVPTLFDPTPIQQVSFWEEPTA